MTLEILEKTMNFRDYSVSLDKTQPKKEEPDYATCKGELLLLIYFQLLTFTSNYFHLLFQSQSIIPIPNPNPNPNKPTHIPSNRNNSRTKSLLRYKKKYISL